MGGGGLRILPHKKWHVWKKDNIERVHRDERIHREMEMEAKKKKQVLDQELRMTQLKSQSQADTNDQIQETSSSKEELTDPKEQRKLKEKIEEYARKEKKRERGNQVTLKESLKRKSIKKRKLDKPWYTYPKHALDHLAETSLKVKKDKDRYDPLETMKKHEKKIKKPKKTSKRINDYDDLRLTDKRISTKRSSEQVAEVRLGTSKKVDLNELRKARLQREEAERKRRHQLFATQ